MFCFPLSVAGGDHECGGAGVDGGVGRGAGLDGGVLPPRGGAVMGAMVGLLPGQRGQVLLQDVRPDRLVSCLNSDTLRHCPLPSHHQQQQQQ